MQQGRSRWSSLFFGLLLTLQSCAIVIAGESPVLYHLGYKPVRPHNASPFVHINITLPSDIPSGKLQMVIPIAIPSDYTTQPYDLFIGSVEAFDSDGHNLSVEKGSAGPVWDIGRRNSSHPFRVKSIRYKSNVKQMEMSILAGGDSSKIRTGYVGIYGISVFGYINGLEERPIQLTAEGPSDWPVFSTLAPQAPPPLHEVTASCLNYYHLADSQIAMGPDLKVVQRNVSYLNGKYELPTYLAVYTEGPLDVDKVSQLTAQAMKGSLEWFGRISPFPEFTYFMQLIRPISPLHFYGWSLEHLQSATLVFTDNGGVQPGANSSVINEHLYNLVHHTLHAWIPKRSYGQHYYPFVWQIGSVFDSIWFAEGFVQYVAALVTQNMTTNRDLFFNCLMNDRFLSPFNDAPEFIRRMDLIYLTAIASTQYSNDWRIASNVFARGALMAWQMDQLIHSKTLDKRGIREALQWTVGWSATHNKAFKIDQLPAFFLTATGVDTSMLYKRWLNPPGNATLPFQTLPSYGCESIY